MGLGRVRPGWQPPEPGEKSSDNGRPCSSARAREAPRIVAQLNIVPDCKETFSRAGSSE